MKNIYDSQNMYETWIFIFTCASFTAICLKLVPSCDAGKCINAFRRFFSRYGVPETILFDNGTHFLSQETQSFISSYDLKWYFNPPLSPWWGGIFERMVRSVKRCLKKILTDFKTGIIESFKPSQDGKKRIAVVKCIIKGRIATLMRPINRLYLIETGPYLMDEDVLSKLKFVNEKNIKFLKEN